MKEDASLRALPLTLHCGRTPVAASGTRTQRRFEAKKTAEAGDCQALLRFTSLQRTAVTFRTMKADAETAHLLGLGPRDDGLVYRIGAVPEADGHPVGLMDLVLPLPLFSKLSRVDLEQSADNLYSVYQRVCGVTVLRMEKRVLARTADDKCDCAIVAGRLHSTPSRAVELHLGFSRGVSRPP